MDDTLVMTGDADLKAYNDVVRLAKRLHERVSRFHSSGGLQICRVCKKEWAG